MGTPRGSASCPVRAKEGSPGPGSVTAGTRDRRPGFPVPSKSSLSPAANEIWLKPAPDAGGRGPGSGGHAEPYRATPHDGSPPCPGPHFPQGSSPWPPGPQQHSVPTVPAPLEQAISAPEGAASIQHSNDFPPSPIPDGPSLPLFSTFTRACHSDTIPIALRFRPTDSLPDARRT